MLGVRSIVACNRPCLRESAGLLDQGGELALDTEPECVEGVFRGGDSYTRIKKVKRLMNVEKSLLNYPDFLLLDLDPYIYSGKEAKGAEPEFNKQGFQKTREVAHWVKELLDSLNVRGFIKTSGKTGLHVLVPWSAEGGYDGHLRLMHRTTVAGDAPV